MAYYYVAATTLQGRSVFQGPFANETEARQILSDRRLLHAKLHSSSHRDRSAAAAEYRASRVKAGESYDLALERMKSSPTSGQRRTEQEDFDEYENEEQVF